ncbi:hypothetical protein K440DRAFT_636447 [Wilcoxina mikolae CBS 423.85]|nr:hypothetical protein K440DRAFT_636447 [Wilcoxina mikolae CBS 423.85]
MLTCITNGLGSSYSGRMVTRLIPLAALYRGTPNGNSAPHRETQELPTNDSGSTGMATSFIPALDCVYVFLTTFADRFEISILFIAGMTTILQTVCFILAGVPLYLGVTFAFLITKGILPTRSFERTKPRLLIRVVRGGTDWGTDVDYYGYGMFIGDGRISIRLIWWIDS